MLAHEAWLAKRMQTGRTADYLVNIHEELPTGKERSAIRVWPRSRWSTSGGPVMDFHFASPVFALTLPLALLAVFATRRLGRRTYLAANFGNVTKSSGRVVPG